MCMCHLHSLLALADCGYEMGRFPRGSWSETFVPNGQSPAPGQSRSFPPLAGEAVGPPPLSQQSQPGGGAETSRLDPYCGSRAIRTLRASPFTFLV